MWYVYASLISSQALREAVSKDELQIVDVNYNINIWECSVDCGTASVAFTLLLSVSNNCLIAQFSFEQSLIDKDTSVWIYFSP